MAGGVDVTGVEGLRDLARDLQRVEPALAKRVRVANKRAAEHVSAEAARRYRARYHQDTGAGAASIRALASTTRAQVAFGSARAPYVPGQEFGSMRFAQFRPWSGFGPGGQGSMGWFVYPTIRDEAAELPELYAELLDEALRTDGEFR